MDVHVIAVFKFTERALSLVRDNVRVSEIPPRRNSSTNYVLAMRGNSLIRRISFRKVAADFCSSESTAVPQYESLPSMEEKEKRKIYE